MFELFSQYNVWRDLYLFLVLKGFIELSYVDFIYLQMCLGAVSGEETGRCFTITYIMPMNIHLMSESTVNMLSK